MEAEDAKPTFFCARHVVWEETFSLGGIDRMIFLHKKRHHSFSSAAFRELSRLRLTPPEYPYGKRIRRNDSIISTAFRISLYPHCSPDPDPSVQLLLIPTIHA